MREREGGREGERRRSERQKWHQLFSSKRSPPLDFDAETKADAACVNLGESINELAPLADRIGERIAGLIMIMNCLGQFLSRDPDPRTDASLAIEPLPMNPAANENAKTLERRTTVSCLNINPLTRDIGAKSLERSRLHDGGNMRA